MDLEKAKRLVSACLSDPVIERLYEEGDELSRHQTKHDIDDANQVMELANKVTAELHNRFPDLLDDWTREVVIPLAAFLHDIGRAINVEDHAKAGAKWSLNYLKELRLSEDDSEGLPMDVIKRICRIVACHRSSAVHKLDFNDPAWAIVVIADKCVGDEERVRPFRAFVLSLLTPLGLTWIPLRKGGIHDRANYAIKHADLVFDENELILKIDMDKRVCSPSLVYKLYGERFNACLKAARYLGLQFRLEFNGELYTYCTRKNTWVPVTRFAIC